VTKVGTSKVGSTISQIGCGTSMACHSKPIKEEEEDSASGYPQAQEDLGSSNSFLFSNMALLVQLMMQGVIITLKAYYIRKMCDRLVKGTKNYKMTIKSIWRALTIRDAIMHGEKS
jgi:hypothetical protein